MSTSNELLKDTLRQHGYSITKARQRVFEALLSHEPRSMRELTTECVPAIDRASLYRTIDLFERLDIVKRLHIGWKYKLELSDQFQPHHHHAICDRCGAIISLPEEAAIEHRLAELAAETGFTMLTHQLELRGLCGACAKAPATT